MADVNDCTEKILERTVICGCMQRSSSRAWFPRHSIAGGVDMTMMLWQGLEQQLQCVYFFSNSSQAPEALQTVTEPLGSMKQVHAVSKWL